MQQGGGRGAGQGGRRPRAAVGRVPPPNSSVRHGSPPPKARSGSTPGREQLRREHGAGSGDSAPAGRQHAPRSPGDTRKLARGPLSSFCGGHFRGRSEHGSGIRRLLNGPCPVAPTRPDGAAGVHAACKLPRAAGFRVCLRCVQVIARARQCTRNQPSAI